MPGKKVKISEDLRGASLSESRMRAEGKARAIESRARVLERIQTVASAVSSSEHDVISLAIPLYSMAQKMLRFRQSRSNWMKDDLLSEPGWDLCLCLFISYCEKNPLHVGEAIRWADVPYTTGLRYLKLLEDVGYIDTEIDARDARHRLVQLSKLGFLEVGATIAAWVDETERR